jgi:uncharacterized protein YjbI with pentapeptide repeats
MLSRAKGFIRIKKMDEHKIYCYHDRKKVAHAFFSPLKGFEAKREFIVNLLAVDRGVSNIDCAGVNFSGVDFSKSTLSMINFGNCDLNRADFSGAHLSSVNLSGCDLSNATFDDAELWGVDLSFAKLNRRSTVSLGKGDGSVTNFSNHVSFKNSRLSNVNFRGVEGLNIDGAMFSDGNLIVKSAYLQEFSPSFSVGGVILAYKSINGWRVNDVIGGDCSFEEFKARMKFRGDLPWESPAYKAKQITKQVVHYIEDMMEWESMNSF